MQLCHGTAGERALNHCAGLGGVNVDFAAVLVIASDHKTVAHGAQFALKDIHVAFEEEHDFQVCLATCV